MTITDQLINDVQLFFRVRRTLRRLRKENKEIPTFVSQSHAKLALKFTFLYKETGLNLATYGDVDLVNEMLSEEYGYEAVAFIPRRNLCGIIPNNGTVEIHYAMDLQSVSPCYCYHTMAEAVEAFNNWDGNGHPPGNWIKHKAEDIEETNPNYIKHSTYSS
jgi:hypothetical protein